MSGEAGEAGRGQISEGSIGPLSCQDFSAGLRGLEPGHDVVGSAS